MAFICGLATHLVCFSAFFLSFKELKTVVNVILFSYLLPVSWCFHLSESLAHFTSLLENTPPLENYIKKL